MEYFFKFKAKFNCETIINSKSYLLNNDDEISFRILLKDEKLKIQINPIEQNNKLESLSYDIEIIENNNDLKIISNNIKIFKMNKEYLIELYEKVIIKDINILFSSNSVLAYNTIKTHILGKNFNVELPDCFTFFTNKKIANLSAFEFKKDNKKYLTLFNNSSIIFSDYFNDIKLENNTIKILSNINDIAKHGRLISINTSNFEKKEEIVYTKNEPIFTKNNKLIPLAFLQALKVKNIKLMKYYLNDNLKEVGNLQNYEDYFGEFKKITLNFNSFINANLFYPTKEPNIFQGKSFNFVLANGKIDKIMQNNL